MSVDVKRAETVLVVEADASERERLGDLLEGSGFDVVQCSGPTGPDYTCIGGREGRCALLDSADVVVLDMWLEGDTAMMGTSSDELAHVYMESGTPLVTLGWPDGINHGFDDDPVARLRRHPSPEELLGAVRSLAPY